MAVSSAAAGCLNLGEFHDIILFLNIYSDVFLSFLYKKVEEEDNHTPLLKMMKCYEVAVKFKP